MYLCLNFSTSHFHANSDSAAVAIPTGDSLTDMNKLIQQLGAVSKLCFHSSHKDFN